MRKAWPRGIFSVFCVLVSGFSLIVVVCTVTSLFLPAFVVHDRLGVPNLRGPQPPSATMSHFDLKRQELVDAASAGQSLTRADFSNCQLTEFPLELLWPFRESLEFLNFGGNRLSSLPDELAQFRRLRILFFAGNAFESVPSVIGQLPQLYMLSFKGNRLRFVPDDSLPPSLTWLILTDNQLSELPPAVGRLTGLRKLMLTGNQFEAVPECIRSCRQLQLLRLSLNRIAAVPRWLLQMPQLAWLAFAGNPCFTAHEHDAVVPVLSIDALRLSEKLGEGASSTVYKATRLTDGQERALKLYRGAVTSDGKADDEIYAVSLVGGHGHLLSPEAVVRGHPSGNTGILLPLVRTAEADAALQPYTDASPLYRVLGLPPSFDSITRDTFPAAHRTAFAAPWTLSFVLSTLEHVADAAAHVHSRGVMHGDLYAHNVLVRDAPGAANDAILTDFGAATLVGHAIIGDDAGEAPQEPPAAALFEAIELRAFAHLVDDLLAHVARGSGDDEQRCIDALRGLHAQLLRDDAAVGVNASGADAAPQPSFAAVAQTLRALQAAAPPAASL